MVQLATQLVDAKQASTTRPTLKIATRCVCAR